MRVAVLGGTGFIGRGIASHLARVGHTVCVIHRGVREPDELFDLQHIHVPREHLRTAVTRLDDFAPDVVVDCYALTRADAEVAATCFRGVPSVVLSSQDVYAAWTGFITDTRLSDAPLTEESPLRASRYLYARSGPPGIPREYEKLDVEEVWGQHGATILRLPMVYGPHDAQCREGFLLRRLVVGRTRIPVGRANLRLSRMHVFDVAIAVEAALHSPRVRGQVINLGEPNPVDMGAWMRQIGKALDVQVELVRVSEDRLPDDLWMTGSRAQHVVADVSRAHQLLGCGAVDVDQRVADSARWHLANQTYATWTTCDDTRDDEALADTHPALELSHGSAAHARTPRGVDTCDDPPPSQAQRERGRQHLEPSWSTSRRRTFVASARRCAGGPPPRGGPTRGLAHLVSPWHLPAIDAQTGSARTAHRYYSSSRRIDAWIYSARR